MRAQGRRARRDPQFSSELTDYLFSDEPIAHDQRRRAARRHRRRRGDEFISSDPHAR